MCNRNETDTGFVFKLLGISDCFVYPYIPLGALIKSTRTRRLGVCTISLRALTYWLLTMCEQVWRHRSRLLDHDHVCLLDVLMGDFFCWPVMIGLWSAPWWMYFLIFQVHAKYASKYVNNDATLGIHWGLKAWPSCRSSIRLWLLRWFMISRPCTCAAVLLTSAVLILFDGFNLQQPSLL